MSLATSIKDFSDTLNHVHAVKSSSLPILPFLQELFVWGVKTILSGVTYIFTFGWFRDFSYLPLLNCEHLPGTGETFNVTGMSMQQLEIENQSSLLFHNSASSLNIERFGNTFFTDPVRHLFSLFNLPAETTNYMFHGLVNSFFFSLPFSLPHLINIRRLFSQGIQAAISSLLGSIAAHSLFLISIFYGLRFLIIPWFSLEPVTYILGFGANVLIIRELIQASPQRFQKSLINTPSGEVGVLPRSLLGGQSGSNNGLFALSRFKAASLQNDTLIKLIRIGLLNFILTWCEELNIFSSITNLTLNAQNTYLDLYPSNDASSAFIIHTIYIVAFVVGNCAFSLFFYYIFFKSVPAVVASWTNFSSIKISDVINKVVMLLIITFTFASFPYYGLDYLFGKIGGFLPEDPAYKETVLSPTKITVNKKNTLFTKAESTDKKKHTSLIDINNFDNGVYLNNLDFNKFDNFPSDSKGSISRTTSFEKSNYRQENAWIRRNYLAKLRARPRKKNNTSTGSLYKAFKDPKAYYHKIQLESDKKQNKSIREEQARNRERFGFFVDREEGILANEPLLKLQNFWNRIFGFPRDVGLSTMPERYAKQSLINGFKKPELQPNKKKIDSFETNLGSNTSKAEALRTQEHAEQSLAKPKPHPYTGFNREKDMYTSSPRGTVMQNEVLQATHQVDLDHNTPNFKSNNHFIDNQGEFFGSNLNNTIGRKDGSLYTETNLFAENYTKGIQKINSLTPPSPKKTKILSTKNIIKRKFFLNPVFRALLQTDIDTFIARQPITHNISENQDYDLYKKRYILGKYYDWLRYYSPLQKNLQARQSSSAYLYEIGTTKSFADSVFHHQFKGTLKIAKRLFPVTFDSQQNIKKSRVLSYDQVLYKDLPTQENPLLHEELLLGDGIKTFEQNRLGKISNSKDSLYDSTYTQPKSLKSAQVDKRSPSKQSFQQNSASEFQELDQKLRLQEPNLNNSKETSNSSMQKPCLPFIEESDSSPFYAGWDDTLRRFVITNNFS